MAPIMANPSQIRFAYEYCVDFNATQAAIRAGYSENSAHVQGCELLKLPKVQEIIEDRKRQIANASLVDAKWVLDQWVQIATADPNDLMQLRRTCCRHCHGFGHQYQWTEAEFMAAVDKAIEAGKPAPDGMGGFGFDQNAEPAEGCPECGGLGVEVVHVQDTRTLRGAAKRLFAGVQRTKDGLKVVTRDQDAAVANIAKFLGMSLERKEISGPGGAPLAIANLRAEDLTDDQLAAILAADEK